MPFDTLPSRLGPINTQALSGGSQWRQPPPVAPIGDIIKHGADQVAAILDTFNPLNKAEREAKIALATMQAHAYQEAQRGNYEPMQELMGHHRNAVDELLKTKLLQQQAEKNGLSLDRVKEEQGARASLFGGATSGGSLNRTYPVAKPNDAKLKAARDSLGSDVNLQLQSPQTDAAPAAEVPQDQIPTTAPEDYWQPGEIPPDWEQLKARLS